MLCFALLVKHHSAARSKLFRESHKTPHTLHFSFLFD